MCVKDVKYIFIGLKMTCLGVLDRGDCGKDDETGLKEGGGIEMSTTVLLRLNTHLYKQRHKMLCVELILQ